LLGSILCKGFTGFLLHNPHGKQEKVRWGLGHSHFTEDEPVPEELIELLKVLQE
jgi:hypothetical protein